MQQLFYSIAFRNLFRHKGKSLIVGGLLFLVAFILTLGNATIKGMNKAMEKNIIHGFTGNMAIISTNQRDKEVFGSFTGRPMALIENYTQMSNILASLDVVEDFMPIGRNVAMLFNTGGTPLFYMIYAVDLDKYQAFFQNKILFLEGKGLEKGEKGMIMGSLIRNQTAETVNLWLYPEKSEIIFSNMPPKVYSNRETLTYAQDAVLVGLSDDVGSDVRLPVKGVFRFESLNALFGGYIVFVDPVSYVEMFNYVVTPITMAPTKRDSLLLHTENFDTLLEENLFSSEPVISGTPYSEKTLREAIKRQETYTYTTEAYNAVIVKTKKGVSDTVALKKVNAALKEARADGIAVSWKEATPQLSQYIGIVQGLFGVIMFMLFLVSLIIVMNTIAMSVVERTSEMGMMRAIGAQKSFLGSMILMETLTLGCVFGGSGILAGSLVSWFLASLKLKASDEMVQLLFGGEYFMPVVGIEDMVANLLILLGVLWLASLYPIRLAKKVTALEAISRE
ncbi:MAG: FtsX-like permease family protein [Brevinematales bacterium]|nr:FtsX-like permease family protein [Brevinematales bacterium]